MAMSRYENNGDPQLSDLNQLYWDASLVSVEDEIDFGFGPCLDNGSRDLTNPIFTEEPTSWVEGGSSAMHDIVMGSRAIGSPPLTPLDVAGPEKSAMAPHALHIRPSADVQYPIVLNTDMTSSPTASTPALSRGSTMEHPPECAPRPYHYNTLPAHGCAPGPHFFRTPYSNTAFGQSSDVLRRCMTLPTTSTFDTVMVYNHSMTRTPLTQPALVDTSGGSSPSFQPSARSGSRVELLQEPYRGGLTSRQSKFIDSSVTYGEFGCRVDKLLNQDYTEMPDHNVRAFEADFAQKVSMRFLFSGQPDYARQVNVCRVCTGKTLQPTKGLLATLAARELDRHIKKCTLRGVIFPREPDQLWLFQIDMPSSGSLQPRFWL